MDFLGSHLWQIWLLFNTLSIRSRYAVKTQHTMISGAMGKKQANNMYPSSSQTSNENQTIASPVADETTYFSYMGPSNKPNNKSQALAAHVTSTLITQPTALKT